MLVSAISENINLNIIFKIHWTHCALVPLKQKTPITFLCAAKVSQINKISFLMTLIQLLEDKQLNNKHKGIKKWSRGLGFENFTNWITSLVNFDTNKKTPYDSKQVSRFSVVGGKMVKTTVTKNKFSQLNNKRLYFYLSLIQFYQKLIILKKKRTKNWKILLVWKRRIAPFRK